jgi:5-methylcytosine-specific restriction enzyme subunit McrC
MKASARREDISNMSTSQDSKDTVQFTEYGIPIRNLWHMLLYAWNEVPLQAVQGWTLEEAERAPTLDALLASILIRLMQQRLRIGLGHDYVEEERMFPGVRGRINFAETLKQRALDRGQLIVEFQGYSANSARNRIIRSALDRLLKVGQFGASQALTREIQQKLRTLIRDLDGISFIELNPDLIRRQLLAQTGHDHDYRLMLAICDLIVQRQMPGGSEGHPLQVVPALDREALLLYHIYERFVANFYRIHLTGWTVSAQKRLEWHAKEANERLPLMVPDLVLQETRPGSDRLIILDTKFTARSLVENQWGKPIYDSAHMYQLYAYLKSQEHLSEAHRNAIGILLYPAVGAKLLERIELQDHLIRIESVDLGAPWQEIENGLITLMH